MKIADWLAELRKRADYQPKTRKHYRDPRVDRIVAVQHAHKRLARRKGIER